MSTRTIEPGTSHEGERAYVTKVNPRGNVFIRESRPLKFGQSVYRVIVRFPHPTYPTETRTTFRSLEHATRWYDTTNDETPS